MKFNEFKHLAEAQFGSKQEVIDHFVKQGKSAAAGAAAWERGWRGSKPKAKKPTGPVRSYHDDLDDKRYGETSESVDPHKFDSDEDYHKAVADSKRPKHKHVDDYPYSPEEDDAYFREIFRKKREAAKKEVKEDKSPCWKNYKRKPGTKKYAPGSCVPKESIESLEAQLAEAALGVAPKRPARPGSRPERGHATESRYKFDKTTGQMAQDDTDPDQRHGLYLDGKLVKTHNSREECENVKKRDPKFKSAEIKKIAEGAKVDRMVKHIGKSERKLGHSKDEAEDIAWATANKRGMLDNKNKKEEDIEEQFCDNCGGSLAEAGKASRSLCTSSKPDADLGASQLSSCKAQGLRARAGEKSHKIGKSRVKVGGHKIKGRKYGGPLPDWS